MYLSQKYSTKLQIEIFTYDGHFRFVNFYYYFLL